MCLIYLAGYDRYDRDYPQRELAHSLDSGLSTSRPFAETKHSADADLDYALNNLDLGRSPGHDRQSFAKYMERQNYDDGAYSQSVTGDRHSALPNLSGSGHSLFGDDGAAFDNQDRTYLTPLNDGAPLDNEHDEPQYFTDDDLHFHGAASPRSHSYYYHSL